MNKIILLMLLSIGLFAQTSEYRTSFYNKRTNQKESGLSGYAWLVPQANSYPVGAVTLYSIPGYDDYYYCIVPDGEYKIYIDLDKSGPGEPVLYRQNVWIGEKRITTMANQFFQTMTDETEKLELSKYSDLEKSSAPDFAKKFSENFEKVDSAVKYFDPRFFEVSGDEVTLNTTLYDSTLVPVADTVINNTSLVPTSASVFRADNRIRADVNNLLALYMLKTGGTFTGAVTAPTLNATTSIQATTAKLTNLTDGYIPYHINDTDGLANSTISISGNNVGIGITSPRAPLEVFSTGWGSIWNTGTAGAQVSVGRDYGGGSPTLNDNIGYIGAVAIYNNVATSLGAIGFAADATATGRVKTRAVFLLSDGTNQVERARITSNGNFLIGNTTGVEKLDVTGNIKASGTIAGTTITGSQFKLSALNTAPGNSSATGTTGEIRIVDGYIYVCVATNTWKRTQLTTW